MKAETDLKTAYETQLKDKLKGLETARKAILQRYFISFFLVIALVAANYFLINTHPNEVLIIVSILVSVSAVIYYIYQTYVKKTNYRQQFKAQVVNELVLLINPEWQYSFDRCISEEAYRASGIFTTHYDRYAGDDFVSGKIERTDFQFSELHTEYKEVTYGSKGRRQERWVTIFKGLFMHADFNKEFMGTTYVLTDTAERLLGRFGQSLQKLSSRGELVKLENPEFEKRFVVYGSDQVESRYILTPTMMEAMVKLSTEFTSGIQFSFVGSRVYCAMNFDSNLFEPNIFRSGVNFSDLSEMYNQFRIIHTLITELNLNTRIWTKE